MSRSPTILAGVSRWVGLARDFAASRAGLPSTGHNSLQAEDLRPPKRLRRSLESTVPAALDLRSVYACLAGDLLLIERECPAPCRQALPGSRSTTRRRFRMISSTRRRPRIRVLGPALLFAGVLALIPGTSYAAYYPGVAHADGYLAASGGCLMLREHDGRVYSVIGNTDGLLNGDHVRLEGRLVPDPGCGAPGFQVSEVQALWGDDYHRSTRYDHLNGEPFTRWAERSGRLGGYQEEREPMERYDRYGHYVYHGPHRHVELR